MIEWFALAAAVGFFLGVLFMLIVPTYAAPRVEITKNGSMTFFVENNEQLQKAIELATKTR